MFINYYIILKKLMKNPITFNSLFYFLHSIFYFFTFFILDISLHFITFLFSSSFFIYFIIFIYLFHHFYFFISSYFFLFFTLFCLILSIVIHRIHFIYIFFIFLLKSYKEMYLSTKLKISTGQSGVLLFFSTVI